MGGHFWASNQNMWEAEMLKKELFKWTICRSFARRWKQPLDNDMILNCNSLKSPLLILLYGNPNKSHFPSCFAKLLRFHSGWVNIFINDMVGSPLKQNMGVMEWKVMNRLFWATINFPSIAWNRGIPRFESGRSTVLDDTLKRWFLHSYFYV